MLKRRPNEGETGIRQVRPGILPCLVANRNINLEEARDRNKKISRKEKRHFALL